MLLVDVIDGQEINHRSDNGRLGRCGVLFDDGLQPVLRFQQRSFVSVKGHDTASNNSPFLVCFGIVNKQVIHVRGKVGAMKVSDAQVQNARRQKLRIVLGNGKLTSFFESGED
eukprot:scaffold41848_cov160-Amphora_coffeaeformis.AAC.1